MLEKINEINGRLKSILNDLSNEKDELSSALEVVQQRIDSKIDEAKGYKTNVDEYKAHIAGLEEEIASFEKDLNDLKENYGNKGLDAIVEVGTKEINAKIVSKQKEIAKQVEKINELTDRARTIKELLINLKKDKKDKKDRFDSVSIALEYYSGEINKIIEYSENNSESLVYLPITDEEVETDVPIIDEPIDDSPVFDEIASIDKEESSEDTDKTSEEKKDDEVEVEETTDKEISNESDLVKEEESPELENDSSLFLKDEDMNLNSFDSKFDFKLDDDNQNIFDEKTSEEDLIKEEDLEDTHFDDTISSLFATQKDNTIDFKTLNDVARYNVLMSNMGLNFYTYDVGGFEGGFESSDLYTRSVQLGTFSPIFKFGSGNSKYYKREPWRWDTETYEITKYYSKFQLILRTN